MTDQKQCTKNRKANTADNATVSLINSFTEFAQLVDYSFMDQLAADPQAQADGQNHRAREVFSGHYVPVTPTALPHPKYISHSRALFTELGLDDNLATDSQFSRLFSGDHSVAIAPMRPYGWATGYALSIYGTEYTQQCPFGTGNGYGDGRAMSIFEMINRRNSVPKRYEMQLKGGGPTPYCRGADGRAVLRSSVREFLAQEYMHALGVPSSRSLTLYVSQSQTVMRPWYQDQSINTDPDMMQANPVAISTRVASSFIRVGQLELFARRTRDSLQEADETAAEQNLAYQQLRALVEHLIEREYQQEIDTSLSFNEKLIQLCQLFSRRLCALMAHWLRVGYCQGNFNADNCPAGGFTLDYGPFGFCERFDPHFQPWTGGGQHFAFFNQPAAAEANFHMFYQSISQLVIEDADTQQALDAVRNGFQEEMRQQLQRMWAAKLGLHQHNQSLFSQLIQLMTQSQVDYCLFFRALCDLPTQVSELTDSFYQACDTQLETQWQDWLTRWQTFLNDGRDLKQVSATMRRSNPKYTWREWLVVPAYQQATEGEYDVIKELQALFSEPYGEQSSQMQDKYCRLKPQALMQAGGISHYSCSS